MRGGPPFAWEPDKGSHVGVMARDAGVETIRWFTTDACYVFHPMNAWEEGDTIFADVMEYPVAPLFPNADGSPPERRVRAAGALDLRSRGDVEHHQARAARRSRRRVSALRRAPRGPGLPARLVRRHHPPQASAAALRHHRPHRPEDGTTDRLICSLRATRRASRCSCRARPDAPEGDGWLVAVVYRGAEDRSDFVVFDAQDIEAGPIGIARLPRRVPFGFHGNWRPA